MDEWWAVMSQLEHVYWTIALISGVLFIVVLVGTFIGGTDTDMDMDTDMEIGFQFFTFKNIVGFFTLFAWSGIASINSGNSNAVTIIISIASGAVMMIIMGMLFRFMSKQVESGTLQIENAVDKSVKYISLLEKTEVQWVKFKLKFKAP